MEKLLNSFISFISDDSIGSKFFIGIISSIITILIKILIDFIIEKKRLTNIKNSLNAFIEEIVLKTLHSISNDYKNLKNSIDTGEILNSHHTTEFPWLNSKVLDYFTKNDILKILNKIDVKETALLNKNLIKLDYLQQNSPTNMFFEFDGFLDKHYEKEGIGIDKLMSHYESNRRILIQRKICVQNIEIRIEECKEIIIYFENLKNKIK